MRPSGHDEWAWRHAETLPVGLLLLVLMLRMAQNGRYVHRRARATHHLTLLLLLLLRVVVMLAVVLVLVLRVWLLVGARLVVASAIDMGRSLPLLLLLDAGKVPNKLGAQRHMIRRELAVGQHRRHDLSQRSRACAA